MRKAKTYVMIPTALIVEAMERTRATFGGHDERSTRKPRRRKARRGRKAARKAVT